MSLELGQQLHFNHHPGPWFEEGRPGQIAPAEPLVRLLAYYLPQFHPIPENDRWWGKGFTEWTNVAKGVPRFEGHYQPRLPADLGFYDLRRPEVLEQQAELARRYGIFGFCLYYYWFGGQRLLETPLENLLANRHIDLPFCICWANENWTRRWDGLDAELLIGQNHSPEDDLAIAASFEQLFDDPRYIRVNDRPVLLLYRPSLLPDAKATIQRWRDHFAARQIANPYIIMVHAFEHSDPGAYGIDAAVTFPPRANPMPPMIDRKPPLLDHRFQGQIMRYDELVAAMTRSQAMEYRLHQGVLTGWDNDARRPNRGFTLLDGTPEKYGDWLSWACEQALQIDEPDARFTFVNAWNEWAEGAYLEPDRHFGHAYLAETARVLHDLADPARLAVRQRRLPVPGMAEKPPLPYRALRRLARNGSLAAEKLAKTLRDF